MELPKPVEVVKDVAEIAYNVGKFTVDRLVGGHWGELASNISKANIQIHTGENVVKGEE